MTATTTQEQADLLETLARHRFFLRYTVRELSDEQAAQRTTASELTLAGLIKHVAATEASWARFIVEGPTALGSGDPQAWGEAAMIARAKQFQMLDDETLTALLQGYEAVARATDDLVASLADLDGTQPLPEAPWFEAGARWSARRVILHIIAETAQHAGHADILRESLDGAKTMG
jgi:uncharacterized damage-inducible protein DinB